MVSSILVLTTQALQKAAKKNDSEDPPFVKGLVDHPIKPVKKDGSKGPAVSESEKQAPKNPGEDNDTKNDDELNDFEILEPLPVKRSFSDPISGPKARFPKNLSWKNGDKAAVRSACLSNNLDLKIDA